MTRKTLETYGRATDLDSLYKMVITIRERVRIAGYPDDTVYLSAPLHLALEEETLTDDSIVLNLRMTVGE